MEITGNLRKMQNSLDEGEAQYELILYNVLEKGASVRMNELIGKDLELEWTGNIHCVESGKPIKKTFGEGMSYEAFRDSPMAVESIVRPELSRIHEGIALRDKEWEEAHHNQPHYVYLSFTSGLKVGVTRTVNVPSRWIDQGAVGAVVIAETPYRQLAGEMEVALKSHFNDRTNWRQMLRFQSIEEAFLSDEKEEAIQLLGEPYADFYSDEDMFTSINYPAVFWPEKVSSTKLDKVSEVRGELVAIKGQYLLFRDGRVINLRSHAGYEVKIRW